MKAIFLTSSIGGYIKVVENDVVIKKIVKCDNSNGFITHLKKYVPNINSMVFIAGNPDGGEKTDDYANTVKESLNLDDFEIKKISIIDNRFKGNIKNTILSADVVFLAGGNVPSQNDFIKKINLKEILKDYKGVVIGQSAGSMNCNKRVYAQPEEDEEFDNPNYKIERDGLGLVNFTIMPHMNNAGKYGELDENNHPTVMTMCVDDSKKLKMPHYGIVDYGFIEIVNGKAISYGKTLLIKNGKCVTLCENGENIELKDNYLYNKIEKNK